MSHGSNNNAFSLSLSSSLKCGVCVSHVAAHTIQILRNNFFPPSLFLWTDGRQTRTDGQTDGRTYGRTRQGPDGTAQKHLCPDRQCGARTIPPRPRRGLVFIWLCALVRRIQNSSDPMLLS